MINSCFISEAYYVFINISSAHKHSYKSTEIVRNFSHVSPQRDDYCLKTFSSKETLLTDSLVTTGVGTATSINQKNMCPKYLTICFPVHYISPLLFDLWVWVWNICAIECPQTLPQKESDSARNPTMHCVAFDRRANYSYLVLHLSMMMLTDTNRIVGVWLCI